MLLGWSGGHAVENALIMSEVPPGNLAFTVPDLLGRHFCFVNIVCGIFSIHIYVTVINYI